MVRLAVLVLCLRTCVCFAAGPTVSLSPSTTSVRVGATKQFTATVTGLTNTAVTYSVANVAGGNATVGTIDANGLYTAPAVLPATTTVQVKAVSVANTAVTDTSTITLLNPAPSIASLDPKGINTGIFALTIAGKGFLTSSTVTLGGLPLTTTYLSPTQLKIAGSTAQPAGTVLPLVVCNPDPGAVCSGAWNMTLLPPVSVSLSPATATLRAGITKQFTAYVSNSSNKNVTFSINGVTGGNALVGTIDATGLYTAPAVPPAANVVTITVVAEADTRATDTSAVTLQNPLPSITGLAPGSAPLGPVTLTLDGAGFVAGSKVMYGSTALATTYVSPTRLTASVDAKATVGGVVAVTVANPDPGAAVSSFLPLRVGPATSVVSYAAAYRFLEQASWGPTPDSVARVQQNGFDAWLNEQKSALLSPIAGPTVDPQYLGPTQKEFFMNALTGPDQLRQRMAFTLGQIFVVSGSKVGRADQTVPYLRLLQQNAFGNYLDLMRAVTLSPTMGKYLDMVNNEKANTAKTRLPNENYGRELLQLFTIGTVLLNPDGSVRTDASGVPVPAYDQTLIENMSRALTGWTYPTMPGAVPQFRNPAYYTGPMEAFEAYHDTAAKTLLNGRVLPAGQSARQDLEDALNNVFMHPNLGPFVARRIIQHFTLSNPSPAYITRVAATFDNNGQGVRGDLWAVLRAALLDPEARSGDVSLIDVAPTGGHLREPVLYITSLLRALGATATADNYLSSRANDMGQNLFSPPSVFNYYSPSYRIPGTAVTAPEFQLLTPSTALVRANFVNTLVNNSFGSTTQFDITPFTQLGTNPSELVAAVDRALLRGQMTAAIRDTILNALTSTTDSRQRARIALYLAASASQYQVER